MDGAKGGVGDPGLPDGGVEFRALVLGVGGHVFDWVLWVGAELCVCMWGRGGGSLDHGFVILESPSKLVGLGVWGSSSRG